MKLSMELLQYVAQTIIDCRRGELCITEFLLLINDIVDSDLAKSLPWTAILNQLNHCVVQFVPGFFDWKELSRIELSKDTLDGLMEALQHELDLFLSPASCGSDSVFLSSSR
jgi:hypothetical protein